MVVPAMKTLGQRALVTGANIGSDILEGKDIKEATTSNLKNEGKNLARAVINRARSVATQSGSGRRRRRTKKACSSKTKKRPVRKHKRRAKKGIAKFPFLQ